MSETLKILSPLKSRSDKNSQTSSDLGIIFEVLSHLGCGIESI